MKYNSLSLTIIVLLCGISCSSLMGMCQRKDSAIPLHTKSNFLKTQQDALRSWQLASGLSILAACSASYTIYKAGWFPSYYVPLVEVFADGRRVPVPPPSVLQRKLLALGAPLIPAGIYRLFKKQFTSTPEDFKRNCWGYTGSDNDTAAYRATGSLALNFLLSSYLSYSAYQGTVAFTGDNRIPTGFDTLALGSNLLLGLFGHFAYGLYLSDKTLKASNVLKEFSEDKPFINYNKKTYSLREVCNRLNDTEQATNRNLDFQAILQAEASGNTDTLFNSIKDSYNALRGTSNPHNKKDAEQARIFTRRLLYYLKPLDAPIVSHGETDYSLNDICNFLNQCDPEKEHKLDAQAILTAKTSGTTGAVMRIIKERFKAVRRKSGLLHYNIDRIAAETYRKHLEKTYSFINFLSDYLDPLDTPMTTYDEKDYSINDIYEYLNQLDTTEGQPLYRETLLSDARSACKQIRCKLKLLKLKLHPDKCGAEQGTPHYITCQAEFKKMFFLGNELLNYLGYKPGASDEDPPEETDAPPASPPQPTPMSEVD